MNTQEKAWRIAAGDLAEELANMHGALLILITDLGETELSSVQRALVDRASIELGLSQGKFFATYADMVGGATPERN